MGTTISTISIPLWTQSKLVYNKVFNKSVIEYLKKYVFYIILTLVAGIITTYICSMIIIKNAFLSLVVKGILCTIVVNLIYLLIFYKTEEFKYLYNIVKPILKRIKNKYICFNNINSLGIIKK